MNGDVFDAFGRARHRFPGFQKEAAALAREWFGPLVGLVERALSPDVQEAAEPVDGWDAWNEEAMGALAMLETRAIGHGFLVLPKDPNEKLDKGDAVFWDADDGLARGEPAP